MSDDVRRGREAFDRRDWLAAFEALSAAGDNALRADDFVELATAAYLLCRADDCITAMQRAHVAYVAAGDLAPAVRTAFWLSLVLRQQGERAVANGWISRAERLASELPDDSVEHGYVAFAQLMRDVFAGKITSTTGLPAVVLDHGRRYGDANLVAAGLMSSGRRAIYTGDVDTGFGFLDEAMVSLLSGELSPIIAGQVLCSCIEACQELWEFGRVSEWTTALDKWCQDQHGLEMYTGTCALHKGQVSALRGDFAGAATEFEESVERLTRGGSPPLVRGEALAELGDALRIQGRLDEAADALRRSVEAGWDPAPAQAMLDLAAGRVGDAALAARRMLAESRSPIRRAQKLTRVVDVLLADGDLAGAAPVVDELTTLSGQLGTGMFRAHARRARGALALATGAPAEQDLRAAVEGFVAEGSAYDAARTRLLLASALEASDEVQGANREREIGMRALAEMGASGPAVPETSGLTERQIEVLKLVAAGQSNREIAAALHLSEKTVARHLSNIFDKLGVQSRTAAAAYAFEHGIAG